MKSINPIAMGHKTKEQLEGEKAKRDKRPIAEEASKNRLQQPRELLLGYLEILF